VEPSSTDKEQAGPAEAPAEEKPAKLPMKELLERLRQAGAVDGTLQNGGGGLAIIGVSTPSKEPAPKPAEPDGDFKEPWASND